MGKHNRALNYSCQIVIKSLCLKTSIEKKKVVETVMWQTIIGIFIWNRSKPSIHVEAMQALSVLEVDLDHQPLFLE
jgi:hypothetical protein